MRIAIATSTARLVGGAEAYLDLVVPLLKQMGHETLLICEADVPAERRRISFGSDTPLKCIQELGLEASLAELVRWRPSVIYSHGMSDAELESRLTTIAPCVRFVHAYYGTCISGGKTFKHPVPLPCERRFGALCLAHFYPHRCGGLNPITMLREYRRQTQRLKALHSHDKIVVCSEHMRLEYLRHDFPVANIQLIAPPIVSSMEQNIENPERSRPPSGVIYIGRMEYLKGGSILIDAMQLAVATLHRPLKLTFVGEGRDRRLWEDRARRSSQNERRLEIAFTGWLDHQALNPLLDGSDLLAVPSLWPEPFGLVGPEAGMRGVPAAAFRVGGIPDWLKDGVNGHLAPADPPTPGGLSWAIVNCLRDQVKHSRLCRGAREQAARFNIETHLRELTAVLDEVVG